MTIIQQIQHDIASLPEDIAQEVWDFALFLRSKREHDERNISPFVSKTPSKNLSADPFIGIWKNRKEMSESSEWVKQLRTTEWAIFKK